MLKDLLKDIYGFDFFLYYPQSGGDYPPLSSSPLQLTPSLVESQIQRIANTAETLINAMSPAVEAKQLKNNKKISKEVEVCTFFFQI